MSWESSFSTVRDNLSYRPISGQNVIEQARMTLSATQRIKEIIQEEQQEVEGTLKIGIIPTLAPYLLPVFIGP